MSVRISIAPSHDNYDDSDPRWSAETDDLVQSLDEQIGTVTRETTAVPGQKGGIETIMAALTSVEVIKEALTIFKAWLTRDRSRKITVTIQKDGEPVTITVDATGIDKSTLQDVLTTALNNQ